MCAFDVLCVVLAGVVAVVSASSNCSSGQYLDKLEGSCQPCSSCPLNHIVRKPCSGHKDTVCGPFYEFEFFNQGPDSKFQDRLPSTPESDSNSQESSAKRVPSQTKGPGVQRGQERWKELCYGLIGALAVVTLLALLYVLITQIKAKRDSNKALTLSDVEDPVVYYDARLLQDPEFPGTSVTVYSDLRHIETQLERNKYCKKFTHRILRPGRGKFEYGNEYIDNNVCPGQGPQLLASIPEQDSHRSAETTTEYAAILPGHSRHSSSSASTDGSTISMV